MRLILALLATALLALAALSAKGAPADGPGNNNRRRSMGNLRPDPSAGGIHNNLRRSMGNLRPHHANHEANLNAFGGDWPLTTPPVRA